MALIPSLLYTLPGGGENLILMWFCIALLLGEGRRSFVMNKLYTHFFDGQYNGAFDGDTIVRGDISVDPSGWHEVYIGDLYFCAIGLLDGGVGEDGIGRYLPVW